MSSYEIVNNFCRNYILDDSKIAPNLVIKEGRIGMDNLIDFTRRFATVEACLEHLRTVRWADGAYCPHCGGSDRIYHFSDGRRHKCGDCKRTFRLITGTIFADSPIKLLPKWFAAIWLDTCHAKGISSVQLAKDIGVTQKTAWHMLRRIRLAAGNDGGGMPGGAGEIDETHIGGKGRNKHTTRRMPGTQGRGTRTKAVGFGIMERDGKTLAFALEGAAARYILPHVSRHVALGSTMTADDHRGYSTLDALYAVQRLDRPAGEHARGKAHMNALEGFRALVKRACMGFHRHWTAKHSQRYLDGCAWRPNCRKMGRADRVTRLLGQGIGVCLPRKISVQ